MPFPKPTPRKVEKARTKRAHAVSRAVCRALVYQRAGGRCESCGARLVLKTSEASIYTLAHIHEKQYRSRGGDDTDPDNCLCLCMKCHREAHGGKP